MKTMLRTCLAIAFCAGCGGAQNSATTTLPATQALAPLRATDFAPEGTFAMLRIDVQRLRASPYRSYANEWMDIAAVRDPQRAADMERYMGLWRDGHALLMMFGYSAGTSTVQAHAQADADPGSPVLSVLTVAEGGYAVEDLEEMMLPLIRTSGWRLQPSADPNPRMWRSSSDPGRFDITSSDGIFIDATHTNAETTFAIASGMATGPGIPEALRHAAEQADFATHDVDVVAVRTADADQGLRRYLDDEVVRSIRSVTMQLDLQSGLQLSARFDCESVETATSLMTAANGVLEVLGQHPTLSTLGLLETVRSIRARVEGTSMMIELRLNDAETREVLERLTGAARLNATLAARPNEDTAPNLSDDDTPSSDTPAQ